MSNFVLMIIADIDQLVRLVKQGKFEIVMDENSFTRTEMIAVSFTQFFRKKKQNKNKFSVQNFLFTEIYGMRW